MQKEDLQVWGLQTKKSVDAKTHSEITQCDRVIAHKSENREKEWDKAKGVHQHMKLGALTSLLVAIFCFKGHSRVNIEPIHNALWDGLQGHQIRNTYPGPDHIGNRLNKVAKMSFASAMSSSFSFGVLRHSEAKWDIQSLGSIIPTPLDTPGIPPHTVGVQDEFKQAYD